MEQTGQPETTHSDPESDHVQNEDLYRQPEKKVQGRPEVKPKPKVYTHVSLIPKPRVLSQRPFQIPTTSSAQEMKETLRLDRPAVLPGNQNTVVSVTMVTSGDQTHVCV